MPEIYVNHLVPSLVMPYDRGNFEVISSFLVFVAPESHMVVSMDRLKHCSKYRMSSNNLISRLVHVKYLILHIFKHSLYMTQWHPSEEKKAGIYALHIARVQPS